ncbi:hypothetical protein L484_014492 [Morus notabilis]|uniref:Uncharacterized protein n=1 Tax=Morus notabilis TaxID=981085 RepID=W9RYW9_9ROSA|nr:hypothetical protein L484_002152 [Morus notabilis]EXC18092.1 hypothetical protein L484_014492 [Morus notabilis]
MADRSTYVRLVCTVKCFLLGEFFDKNGRNSPSSAVITRFPLFYRRRLFSLSANLILAILSSFCARPPPQPQLDHQTRHLRLISEPISVVTKDEKGQGRFSVVWGPVNFDRRCNCRERRKRVIRKGDRVGFQLPTWRFLRRVTTQNDLTISGSNSQQR